MGDIMSIVYKQDIIAALKEKGYSTYRLRKEKILAESTIQAFRNGTMVSFENLNKLCKLLDCQIGDILEYIPDENTQKEG